MTAPKLNFTEAHDLRNENGFLAYETGKRLVLDRQFKQVRRVAAAECCASDEVFSRERVDELLIFEDSYSRLPTVIKLAKGMERGEWLRLLGDEWSGFDNIGVYQRHLLKDTPFREAKHGAVFDMMSAEELETWHGLPDEVTVFRGCYANNRDGLCWSLDRGVAERFPTFHRYRGDGPPLLIEARVSKHAVAAVKLDRREIEIVTAAAVPVSTTVFCAEVASC